MEIEFRHLQYFVAVAEERSLNRAAARLHLSQPTLTRQLGQLEEHLGVKLLDRHRSGVTLTEAGETFLGRARAVLAEQQALLAEMKGFAGGDKLRIAYIARSLFGPVGRAMAELRRRHPEMTLEIVEAPPTLGFQMLMRQEVDVAFVGFWETEPPLELEARALFQNPLSAVLPRSHRLAGRDSIDLAELADDTFVVLRDDLFPGRRSTIRRACREAGFEVRFEQTGDSLLSLLSLIEHEQGVSLVPFDAAAMAPPRVVFVPLTGPAGKMVVFHALVCRGVDNVLRDELMELCREAGT